MSSDKFAVQIGGENITVPGVYTVPDKSAMVPQRGTLSRSMAIVASSRGGLVNQVTVLSPGDEQRVLRSGPGAQMAKAAFSHGVRQILYVRVDQATPAVLNLDGGQLVAVNPGIGSRALQGKVSLNSARADAFDLFVQDGTGQFAPETYMGIGPLVDVAYVGTGSAPSVTVTRDADGEATISFSATGDSGATLTVQGSAVGTVSALVSSLNRSGSWHASGVSAPTTLVNLLENQTVTFVPSADGTKQIGTLRSGPLMVQAMLQNSKLARFVPGTDPLKADSGHILGIRLNGVYEFFTGGSDGPQPSTTDYVNALRLLEGLPIVGIACDAPNVSTAAVVASHVTAMSSVKARRERWAAVGVPQAATKQEFFNQSIALATTFSDLDRMVVAGNLPYDNDVQTNRLEKQPAAVLAAAAVAIKIVGRPEEPLTFKSLRFSRFEYAWSTEELEELLEGGVMPAHYDQMEGRNLIVQGLTTYTLDANVASRKLAAVDSIDYLDQIVRRRISGLTIGKVADEPRIKAVVASIAALLNGEIRGTKNPNGVLTPGLDPNTGAALPAYRNLVAVFDGADFLGVDFDANLVGEIAYVAVRPRFTPAQIEVRN